MTQRITSPALSRRHLLGCTAGLIAAPGAAFAKTPRQVTWDDLLAEGVPYSEIIGEGEMDMLNDTWNPIYDANATVLNEDLANAYIKMPGYIVPLELSTEGTTEFILVPYVGACVHVPPPPPNQLVHTTINPAWPIDDPWAAVWVTGTMQTQLQSTQIAETGYALTADEIELFEW